MKAEAAPPDQHGMILQREQTIAIWGWAKPGTAVTVKFLEWNIPPWQA